MHGRGALGSTGVRFERGGMYMVGGAVFQPEEGENPKPSHLLFSRPFALGMLPWKTMFMLMPNIFEVSRLRWLILT